MSAEYLIVSVVFLFVCLFLLKLFSCIVVHQLICFRIFLMFLFLLCGKLYWHSLPWAVNKYSTVGVGEGAWTVIWHAMHQPEPGPQSTCPACTSTVSPPEAQHQLPPCAHLRYMSMSTEQRQQASTNTNPGLLLLTVICKIISGLLFVCLFVCVLIKESISFWPCSWGRSPRKLGAAYVHVQTAEHHLLYDSPGTALSELPAPVWQLA